MSAVAPVVLEGPLTDAGIEEGLAAAISSAVVFVVAFVALALVAHAVVMPLIDRLLSSRDLDEHARRPIAKIAWGLVLFGVIAIAFGIAGYGNFLVALATIGAAATIALGFAMQSVLSNFVSGVFIFTEKPFRIGDWIEWDEHSGIVEDISLRVTRVRTFDNELLTVPNSQLADGVVKNPVANDSLRLKFDFGIGYDDDIDEATEIIVEEAREHPEIMNDPAPSVRLTELGDSDIGLQSRIWVADPSRADFVRIRGEYVQSVKERFDAVGIDIPYPYRNLDGKVLVRNVAEEAIGSIGEGTE
ncbi:mechanosensitive ion channel family protein [Natronorarus salvus]|uniref:mechanosensitive ion channel family protein n=1 Tax=Natronorarus salvus TaxID=3117733 RepID=UPI002F26A9CD